MCYDEQIISAYVDGELEGPLSTEVKKHIESCQRCQGLAAEFSAVNELFTAVQSTCSIDSNQRKARVWQEIRRQTNRETVQNFWHRRVQIPMPLAAGVVVAVAALVFTLIMNPFSSNVKGTPITLQQDKSMDTTIPAVPSDFTSPGSTIPELEQLVRFLSDQGAAIEVKIELPSSSKIQVSGEPQLLRAADLRRDEIE